MMCVVIRGASAHQVYPYKEYLVYILLQRSFLIELLAYAGISCRSLVDRLLLKPDYNISSKPSARVVTSFSCAASAFSCATVPDAISCKHSVGFGYRELYSISYNLASKATQLRLPVVQGDSALKTMHSEKNRSRLQPQILLLVRGIPSIGTRSNTQHQMGT